ncbi:MAG: cytochrome c [Deltaproteobacteria bacterium]|nr:cytochrome c [Deltaproteobacteria bacterium]
MHRHAGDASDLLWAVLRLDSPEVELLSRRIAEEPQLARPTSDTPSDMLNRALPPKFFVYQEELKARAEALARAARAKDNDEVASAFGQMVETCVACHDTYVNKKP